MTNKYLGNSFVIFTIVTNLLIELIFPIFISSDITILHFFFLLLGFIIFYFAIVIFHEMIIIHAFHLDFNTKTSINQRTSIIQDEEIEDNDNIYDYIEEEPDKQDDANQSISQEELSSIIDQKDSFTDL